MKGPLAPDPPTGLSQRPLATVKEHFLSVKRRAPASSHDVRVWRCARLDNGKPSVVT